MEERSEPVALWAFCVAVFLCGVGLAAAATQLPAASFERPFQINFVVLAIGFLIAERYNVHLEIRNHAHTLTFAELPLTFGLIFASPTDLVLSRMVVSAVALLAFRSITPVKFVFNVGNFGCEVGVSLFVYHAVLGGGAAAEPRGWAAAFLAIAAGHLIGAALVTAVMRLVDAFEGLWAHFQVLAVAFGSAMTSTSVALAATAVLWYESQAWILLLVIGAGIGFFFTSYVDIRARHQSLATLHGFVADLAAAQRPDDLARAIGSGIADLLSADHVIVIAPMGDDVTRIEWTKGDLTISTGQSEQELEWLSAMTGAPVQRRRISGLSSRFSRGPHFVGAQIPMPDRPGVVVVDDRISTVRSFDPEDVQLLETAAGHAAGALRNAQLLERMRDEARFRSHQALHDDITDLPNQRSLVETLDGQLAENDSLVMLTVRTHSLREVNETLGRSVGDEMLRQVAGRLQQIGRNSWCARSGTDEFTLVIPGGQEEADEIAQRIVEAFDQPVLCNDVALAVTVGIGVALAPIHGTEAEMLVRRASLAASRSALDGTTVTTWASDRDPYDPHRLTIAADLRDAIPAGELEVHFQPQLDLSANAVTGVEALVRWRHPRLGQLRPDQFIAAAEHTGAIDALTFHVLTVAAETGARWHQMGWELDVAVNLSARNLTHPNFAGEVANILEVTGFPATSLTLELTESSVMTEAERAMTTLQDLHGLGVVISIDDFGTGYSSLAHLRRLPVSEIKIDKSFVLDLMTNASDAAIVRSMIELGHNLGLTVVAEGVETVEVRDMLQELRSDRLQGYLLSRPLTSSAFEHWFTERQGSPVRAGDEGEPDSAQVVNLESRR